MNLDDDAVPLRPLIGRHAGVLAELAEEPVTTASQLAEFLRILTQRHEAGEPWNARHRLAVLAALDDVVTGHTDLPPGKDHTP